MASQGVFTPDEIGFSRIVDTPEEAVEMVLKSLPENFRSELKSPSSVGKSTDRRRSLKSSTDRKSRT
jgi:hypothetical protein